MSAAARKVNRIVVHCSAGPAGQRGKDIAAWHTRPASRGGLGWSAPGYHYVVEADGTVVRIFPEDRIANGAKGYNRDSIHVCYTGGIDSRGNPSDTRTAAQKGSLLRLISEIRSRRGNLKVVGHRDLSPDLDGDGVISPWERIKACPCFDAMPEYGGG